MRFILLLAVALAARPLAAQTAEQLEILRSNPTLVRERIQASGLSADQVRDRLRAAGYPANLLDAYLDAEGDTALEPGALTVSALRVLGLPFAEATGALGIDSGSIRSRADSEPSRVFGVDVFRRSTTQFLPLLSGPVPSTYVLGPGDVLVLILTGDVELSYTLPVSREGFVIVPQVGQLYVANLTMTQLRDQLFARLSRAYSGIRRGPRATTQFDVSVANVRANQVYVVGEVTQPGAYQLSALGTVMTALYAAGGVTERAGLRQVELRRGDSVVARLDLYDYLLHGDTRSDVRLETGDVVFVGTRGPRVVLAGPVVRPGIYEVRDDDDLRSVIEAAGGFGADAQLERLTVHRILATSEHGPGPAPRAAITVPLVLGPDSSVVIPPFGLRDGDSIDVHPVPPLSETYYVGIGGMVQAAGTYPWRPGMTLRDLMTLAQGPRVGADLREAEIARLPADRQTGQLAEQFRVPMDSSYLLARDAEGRFEGPPGPDFAPPGASPEVLIEPFDQVLIFKQPGFEFQRTVSVQGEVVYPGQYTILRKDERLSDIIGRAGGLLPTAYLGGGRLYREFEDAGRVNVSLEEALATPGTGRDPILQPGDSLYVPEFIATVRIQGAVNSPASVLYREGEDLDYYIANAGGYARDADKGRVSVRYANGSAQVKSRFLFFWSNPTPGPGSVVLVPATEPSAGFNTTQFLSAVAQILASTVAIIAIATR